MERVAELVEHPGDVVERQQRGLAGRRLGHVEVVDHDRLVVEQARLIDERVHPRAALLVVALVVIEQQEADDRAVGVVDVEHAHVGLVHRQVVALGERQAVELVRRVEHAVLQHAVLEVRLDLGGVEIEPRLAPSA